jgi:hypothetical protein
MTSATGHLSKKASVHLAESLVFTWSWLAYICFNTYYLPNWTVQLLTLAHTERGDEDEEQEEKEKEEEEEKQTRTICYSYGVHDRK